MKTMMKMMMTATLTTLTACNYIENRDYAKERSEKGYNEAMADLNAGRSEAAAEGLKKVLRANPLNTSARFQLACLQAEVLKDYGSAYVNFKEFLLLAPDSDKAKLAEDRMRDCERDLAKNLALTYGIVSGTSSAEERKRIEAEVKRLADENTANKKKIAELERLKTSLEAENTRIKRVFAKTGMEDAGSKAPKLDKDALNREMEEDLTKKRFSKSEIDALARMDDEELDNSFDVSEAKKLGAKNDSDFTNGYRKGDIDKIKAGLDDEDMTAARDSLLDDERNFAEDLEAPEISPEARELMEDDSEKDSKPPIKTDKVKSDKSEKKSRSNFDFKGENSDKTIEKPATYTVQSGDSIYTIALRFYGDTSRDTYNKIQRANKAVIKAGTYEIQAGKTIKLP